MGGVVTRIMRDDLEDRCTSGMTGTLVQPGSSEVDGLRENGRTRMISGDAMV